jgi:hypothetical protein
MGKGTKILAFAALLLVALQLLPVDRTNPPERQPLVIADGQVRDLVDRACADCHSHSTTWPWYSRVAPVSLFLAHHVEEGREHLNLSTWGELPADRKDHALEEMVEVLEEGEMPLRSYTLAHAEARLTDEDRQVLMDWAREQRRALGQPGSALDESSGEVEEGHEG